MGFTSLLTYVATLMSQRIQMGDSEEQTGGTGLADKRKYERMGLVLPRIT